MKPEAYSKYERAQKRVKQIKGFYGHVKLFFLLSIIILIGRFYVLPQLGIVSNDPGFVNWLNWNTYLFPGIWAIVIIIHGLSVFKLKAVKKWEERKISELMEEEEELSGRWD